MAQYFFALIEALKTREDEGQGMVEYALILVLVSIAAVIALTAMGDLIGPIFDEVSASLGV